MSSVAFLGPQNASTSLVAGASPETPLRALTALPEPLLGLWGLLLRAMLLRGGEGIGREKRKGEVYARKPWRRHCSDALSHGCKKTGNDKQSYNSKRYKIPTGIS